MDRILKIRAPRLSGWFHGARWLLSWLPLLQKNGGSFPAKEWKNLETQGNETRLRAGIPYWKQGTYVPECSFLLGYHRSTTLAARLHPLGSEDPFWETEQLKRKTFRILTLGQAITGEPTVKKPQGLPSAPYGLILFTMSSNHLTFKESL